MSLASCDRLIAAPIGVVWDLLTTPRGLNTWMSVEATVELWPGGTIRWVHDSGWVVRGEVTQVEPPRRFAFTYGWEHGGFPVPPGSSLVTIDLESRGGQTQLRLDHRHLTAPMAAQHSEGWEMFIARLAAAADHEEIT